MAITIGALVSESGSLDANYRRDYSRTYRVKCTDRATEGTPQILATFLSAGFTPYSPHPSDTKALLQKISPAIVSQFNDGPMHGLIWNVTLDYGPVSPLDVIAGGDPTSQPIRYRLDPQTSERPVFVDCNDDPVVNSAGDYFDPPITEEVTRYQLTVMRSETSIDIPTIMAICTYSKKNNAEWNGFPEGTVKLMPIKVPERQWSQEAQLLYWPMEYVFLIDFDGWDTKVLDQGMRRLQTISSVVKQVAITDGMGQPVTTPALLNGSGVPLTLPVTHTNIRVLPFSIVEPFDFSALGLDDILS